MDISSQWPRITSLLLITLFFTHQTFADIYKCKQPDGTVQFSDAACEDGKTEAVALQINSAMDSSAERENIASYNEEKQHNKRRSTSPQIQLLSDIQTEERNTRITSKEIRDKQKTKRRNKSKKTKTANTKKTGQ